jgi:hypothetical protein
LPLGPLRLSYYSAASSITKNQGLITDFGTTRTALVVAHPGHELRVYHWLRIARPCVFVLTDGSGHSGRSRLGRTTALLKQVSARQGSIYGRFTDREIYSAILSHNHRLFIDAAEELARALVAGEFEYVAGDRAEGYNPVHDVCRYVIDAAVDLANRKRGASISNYDFALAGIDRGRPPDTLETELSLELTDDELSQKLDAARSYDELSADIDEMLKVGGMDGIRTETLRPVPRVPLNEGVNVERPFYETYGEKQVAAGHYQTVLRYREHLMPLANALRQYPERKE